MALEIFIAESGYTGEHLLDPVQPIFARDVLKNNGIKLHRLNDGFGGEFATIAFRSGLGSYKAQPSAASDDRPNF
jgi:hypothetical protein